LIEAVAWPRLAAHAIRIGARFGGMAGTLTGLGPQAWQRE
jgi:hypothetical protein